MKKDYQTRQTETLQTEAITLEEQDLALSLYESRDMNRRQQCGLSGLYRLGISQLQQIFELMHRESVEFEGDLPTSFGRVEKEIAKCISGCLSDVPEQKNRISEVQSLLRDYRVLAPARRGTTSVSLHQLYMLLQDNFQGSSLLGLLRIFIDGQKNVQPKTIVF
ncbi:MAG: hypothetical protein LBH91_03160 [Prevotellaceae bacterium]|jgi:hypothetical protein|nr:hypothetical protein [Prevotellaceae bacterium]